MKRGNLEMGRELVEVQPSCIRRGRSTGVGGHVNSACPYHLLRIRTDSINDSFPLPLPYPAPIECKERRSACCVGAQRRACEQGGVGD